MHSPWTPKRGPPSETLLLSPTPCLQLPFLFPPLPRHGLRAQDTRAHPQLRSAHLRRCPCPEPSPPAAVSQTPLDDPQEFMLTAATLGPTPTQEAWAGSRKPPSILLEARPPPPWSCPQALNPTSSVSLKSIPSLLPPPSARPSGSVPRMPISTRRAPGRHWGLHTPVHRSPSDPQGSVHMSPTAHPSWGSPWRAPSSQVPSMPTLPLGLSTHGSIPLPGMLPADG